MAANRFYPFAHAAQAVAFAGSGVLAVVFNHQLAVTCFGDEAKTAGGGAGVAHDVGYGFAQHQSKSCFFLRAERCSLCGVAFGDKRDARGIKRETRGFNLGGQAAGAITADSFTDFGKGGTGGQGGQNPSDANSVGSGWAVLGSGQLANSVGDDNGWVFKSGDSEMISGLVDVSTSLSYEWLLKPDGSVWATKSGFTEQSVGTSFTAKSICGGQGDYCFAVNADGAPYRTTDPTPMG